jgi:hypothetical protein
MHRLLAMIQGAARAARASRAALVIAVLLFCAAGHWLHHVSDPACAEGAGGAGHACAVCSGMHASSLVATVTTAPAPLPNRWQLAPAAPAIAPRARAAVAAPPRAPPAS